MRPLGVGSAQSFGGSAYAAVSRNPHALPPGARGYQRLAALSSASQATPGSQTTPRNHPTKPLVGFARTPDRGAISWDAGSRPRFAGTPFSSGVALLQLLVVRRSKRPTAARHEQG